MKALKTTQLIVLFLVYSHFIQAQVTIQGTISDLSDNPVAGALVEVINVKNTQEVFSSTTGSNGSYFITVTYSDIKRKIEVHPADHIVLRNYPNPFNPSTVIYFEIPQPSPVQITIFDVLGRKVKSFPQHYFSAGSNQVIWDATNNLGISIAAGLYFCRIQTRQNVRAHKMLLLDGGTGKASGMHSVRTPSAKQKSVNTIERFQFMLRVSRESFATLELDSLICTQDTTINAQVSKIVTQTIGPNGGAIAITGFELSVPSGAFTEEHNLSVFQTYEENPFGPNTASHTFQIDGMPDTIAEPIVIEMAYQDTLSHESYIASGVPGYTLEENETITFYDLLETSEHDGRLRAELLPKDIEFGPGVGKKLQLNKYSEDNKSITFTAATDYDKSGETEHFECHIPWMYFNYVNDILLGVEYQYERLESLGISFPENELKIKLLIKPFNSSSFATSAFRHKLFKIKNWDIYINSELLNRQNLENIISELGSLIFRIRMYKAAGLDDEYIWIMKMYDAWADKFFSLDPNLKYPELFQNNELKPFSGIFFTDQLQNKQLKEHWYGMSAFLEFLTNPDMYGNSIVGKIYDKLENGKNTKEALIESVPQWDENVWPNFCLNYVEGNIYNVKSTVFQENLSLPVYNFNEDGPTSHIFYNYFIDLSADIYQVNFNYTDIDSVFVSVDAANVYPIIFGLKYDDSVMYLPGTKIGDVRDLIAQGYDQMLIVVANNNMSPPNYDETTDVVTTVSVAEADSIIGKWEGILLLSWGWSTLNIERSSWTVYVAGKGNFEYTVSYWDAKAQYAVLYDFDDGVADKTPYTKFSWIFEDSDNIYMTIYESQETLEQAINTNESSSTSYLQRVDE